LIDAMWMPRLEEFAPQMVFVSAGFDAHREDELGQLGLVEADYEWITRRIKQVADRHARGRIVSCLEGGYNLGALARSVAVHLRVLAEV
jgi:acetoin utilization deacetylase AcuC-like enzyme